MARNNRKSSRREKRKARTSFRQEEDQLAQRYHNEPRRRPKPLEARTESQGLYISHILHSTITFGTGPAGTGKTYVAAALAAEQLEAKEIEKIIITRPAVEADEQYGFLPGELEEKFEPWLQPFMDVFEERLGKSHVENLIKLGKIEARPLGYMRGSTFKNAWIILDEAQNTTVKQMKMFLSRIGEGSKMIINGDIKQTDLPRNIMSGLEDAVQRFARKKGFSAVEFTRDDIVRHGIVRTVIDAYEN